jgi:hypothetical protein
MTLQQHTNLTWKTLTQQGGLRVTQPATTPGQLRQKKTKTKKKEPKAKTKAKTIKSNLAHQKKKTHPPQGGGGQNQKKTKQKKPAPASQ